MNKQSGFSIFELCAVIVVITTLISIATPKISAVFNQTNAVATKMEMRNIVTMANLYEIQHNKLPNKLRDLSDNLLTKSYTLDSYEYDKKNRRICSKQINYCMGL